MSKDDELIGLIDFVYAAVLDGALWPEVLAKLADTTGTMQAIIATMDRRTKNFDSISRRTIEELDVSYKRYWAFRNPLWAQAAALPSGAIFSLDSLMPRQDFARTAIYNEWWKPADYSLAMLGACLQNDDRLSSVICIINAPDKDALTEEQTRIFEKAVRHIARALRIYRQLWTLKHRPFATAEQFESLPQGAILADASANVLFINAQARKTLESEKNIALKGGRLETTDDSGALQQLIASCGFSIGALCGPLGGRVEVPRGPRRAPLTLVITPFRTLNFGAEIPWLGLRLPAALVTITDPEIGRRRFVQDLHKRFGLTAAEAGLAAEIIKGDGREAAARRRGISVATARSQLSSIFEKTGTHRQAELVHLLLELTSETNLRKKEN
jgi:DNA-binding CsgD family transcriptional regulator